LRQHVSIGGGCDENRTPADQTGAKQISRSPGAADGVDAPVTFLHHIPFL
jgi:hypothetical protein